MGKMTKDCGWRVTQQWTGVKTLQGFDLKELRCVDIDTMLMARLTNDWSNGELGGRCLH